MNDIQIMQEMVGIEVNSQINKQDIRIEELRNQLIQAFDLNAREIEKINNEIKTKNILLGIISTVLAIFLTLLISKLFN